mgnify:CR=1 FL=1
MVMNVQDRGVLPEEMRYTYSVCPVCLKRIPAKREERDGQIYLVKTCPEHGTFSSVIWRNKRKFADWRGERPAVGENENLNCPAGCGLCAEHRRATCCTLLEITARCNMNCTFCFAEPDGTQDPSLDTVKRWIDDLTEPGKTLLQLSGGEPTVRDDLPEIVAYAKQVGCKYVQLNSNGLRLAEDGAFVKRLADAGLSFVFMQFDGVDDAVYEKLRRRPMLEVKKRAIEQCGRYGIGVTLVPVIVPGVNTEQIGDIIRFAIQRSPYVRGVHFQPVSYFGRIPELPADDDRYTLDELLERKEGVSEEVLKKLREKAETFFVEVEDGGIKDVILPGEIREIMNTVLAAEKRAQASIITRREEVASTRSLLNTARLMEENRTLYQLKELESIERICSNVGNISLNGSGDILAQLSELLRGRGVSEE